LNKKHLQSNAMATLVVQQRESPRGLLFSNNNQLCGRDTGSQIITVNKPKGKLKKLAFSGIQVLSPKIFNFFPKKNIFSIIEFYLEVAKTEHIQGITFDKQQWFDLGSREKIDAAEKIFYQKQYP
ncbi:MAG: nucleotidyltransferase family protein, partial [Bacteroidales bacterium]|nr:nucleotidyltransferase family protein [Bacteroidales bacterium]